MTNVPLGQQEVGKVHYLFQLLAFPFASPEQSLTKEFTINKPENIYEAQRTHVKWYWELRDRQRQQYKEKIGFPLAIVC